MAGAREAIGAGPQRSARPPRQEELAYRLRQQSVFADFGRRALEASTFDDLLNAAVALCADGVHARFSGAMEFLPERNVLLLRAGTGWGPGRVGRELLEMDTPAGVAFRTGEPVVASHPADGRRFRTPSILTEHGVKRTVIAPIPLGGGRRWGALGAGDSDESGQWDEADIEFMTAMARLLGVAIERNEARRDVEEAAALFRLNAPALGSEREVGHIPHQEREPAAEARAGEARFRAVAESIPGLVFEADAEGRNSYANRMFLAYTGQPRRVLREDWGKLVHPDDRARVVAAWAEATRTGAVHEIECRLRRADGAWRWFKVRAQPFRDAEGRVEKWVGVCTDVTDQREAIELQRTLLQEVSHRVKNSLALVSSVLKLQARTLEGAPRTALEEASQRVHMVARVHDQLWRSAGTRNIDLQAFLSDLCETIGTAAPRHRTVCRIEPAIVSADLAVPLGLLANELMTNAYKHAYPEGVEGEVRLLGSREPKGRYRLEVSDCGRGLPPGFDLARAADSLGMRVITSLAAQLGGELTAASAEPGARFTLIFPLEPGRTGDA